ncbi:MAG: hypothetical protein JNM27_01655 [Leptospirales bacterium]|nr:hypothetical protein [Leptospirales bacterium]
MNHPIHYIMQQYRKARILFSTKISRRILGGLTLAGGVLAFGLFAQAGFKDSNDAGADALLRSMGGDVSDIPRIPGPIEDRKKQEEVASDRALQIDREEAGKSRPARDRVANAARQDRKDKASESKNTERKAAERRAADRQKATLDIENSRPVAGFPTNLDPTPRTLFVHDDPSFYRGIYITNEVIRIPSMYEPLLRASKNAGMNTLVVDVQLVGKDHIAVERMPPEAFMKLARSYGFYMVARVVCFQGGLDTYPPSLTKLESVLRAAENAARMGFMEVQLDYIRFADNRNLSRVGLAQRYRTVGGILKMATDRLRPYGIRVGADIFGRVVFNNDDIIGQKIELFSSHLDTLYPMLYPSHFYGELDRRKDPYKTIYDGVRASRARSGSTRVIAYIQGFPMRVHESGLNLTDYIKAQLRASEDSGGDGYVVWHAANTYGPFFAAVEALKKEQGKRKPASASR